MTRPSIALRAILLIGSAALAACQDDAPSPIAPPSTASAAKIGTSGKPGSVEQVVFTGDRDGNVDIYIMNADGTNLRRVTTDSSRDEQAAFSPDNKRIVYVRPSMVRSLASQDDELWTAYTDGSKRASILKMNAVLSHPRYSPDGTKIVFAAFLPSKLNTEIFVVNADGTGLNPAFNPDGGHRMAYVDWGRNVVRVFDLDRENPTIDVGPAGTPGSTLSPTWTKDGSQVVFSSNRGIEDNFELYIGTPGKAAATDVRRLTVFGPGDAQMPAYSN